MKNMLAIVWMALSFALFSRHLFHRTDIASSIQQEWTDQSQHRKRKRRKYKNRKYTPRKFFIEKHFKLKGTYPKDARFSDQSRLRRMFRNC